MHNCIRPNMKHAPRSKHGSWACFWNEMRSGSRRAAGEWFMVGCVASDIFFLESALELSTLVPAPPPQNVQLCVPSWPKEVTDPEDQKPKASRHILPLAGLSGFPQLETHLVKNAVRKRLSGAPMPTEQRRPFICMYSCLAAPHFLEKNETAKTHKCNRRS